MRHIRQIVALLALTLGICLRTSPLLAGEVRVPIGPYGGGMVLVAQVKSVKELREDGLQLQKLDYSCGSAALATILTSYLNIPCTETEIIEAIVKNGDVQTIAARKGFSLLDLKRYAETRNVKVTAYKLAYQQLVDLKCPVLLPIYIKEQKQRHFVVFLGEIDGRVVLADPALGRRSLPRDEFQRQWDLQMGMVFSTPTMLPQAQTALAICPQDETLLPAATLLEIAIPASMTYIHMVNEF